MNMLEQLSRAILRFVEYPSPTRAQNEYRLQWSLLAQEVRSKFECKVDVQRN